MKKKILLFALPFLMALSSCSGVYVAPKERIMIEDTLAHDEIFGESSPLELRVPKKELGGNPSMLDRALPAIGVQYQENGDNISIRFVAAIDIGDGDINDFKAVWKRTFYWSDNSVGKSEDDFESNKAYVSLNNKESVYSISDFNGLSGTYDYFVVYTMRNIPKETYKWCRLNAYLELNDGAAYSKVLSTTVDGAFSFVFEHDSENYFLTGTIDGIQQDVAQHDPTLGDGNTASFIADIAEGDSFLLVHKTNSEFRVFGGSDLGTEGDTPTYFEQGDGKIKAKSGVNGNFAFYLNSDKLWSSTPLVAGPKGYYVRGDAAQGWDNFTLQLAQEDWENLMLIRNVYLTEEKEFKIGTNTWSSEYNWSNLLKDGKGEHDNFEEGAEGNIKVKKDNSGYYNIYVTINGYLAIVAVA